VNTVNRTEDRSSQPSDALDDTHVGSDVYALGPSSLDVRSACDIQGSNGQAGHFQAEDATLRENLEGLFTWANMPI
jgi:hypothetical protein